MKRFVTSAALGAVSARAVRKALAQIGWRKEWERHNYRDAKVSLAGGIVTAAGLVLSQAGLLLVVKDPVQRRRLIAALASSSVAGVVGYIDDMDQGGHDGSQPSKGFKGHLGALAQGQITTGVIKIVGIGSVGAIAGFSLAKADRSLTPMTRLVRGLVATGLIAGSANLANLFDLRPGRVHKVAFACAGALGCTAGDAGDLIAGSTGGVAASGFVPDVREETMNGDTGANAFGASLGVAATSLPLGAQMITLGSVIGLTAASEKISFTRVIENNPILNWIDQLGRN